MVDVSGLRARAEAWLADDPSPEDRDELKALLASEAWPEIADRFAGRLEFGTAGLRGVLGAGPNRMNRAVVRVATHGLAEALLEHVDAPKTRGVVIGYDGRVLSRELAADTASVLAARGIRAYLFPDLGPTPLTAYALTALGCAAGVVVTASHNPPEYNGYKAYWENGAQIVPPVDEGIARPSPRPRPRKCPPSSRSTRPARRGSWSTMPATIEEQLPRERPRPLVPSRGQRRDLRSCTPRCTAWAARRRDARCSRGKASRTCTS
jgi:phosphomannomutase